MIHKFRRGKKFKYTEREDLSLMSFDEISSKLGFVSLFCEGNILVRPGDKVSIGTPLSEFGGFVTHSSLSGEVTGINGKTVTVKNDGERSRTEELPFGVKTGKTLYDLDAESFIKLVAEGGIVESDSTVKTCTLLESAYKKAKTLVINAVCTEEGDISPRYIITSCIDEIISSMKIIMSAMGIKEGVIVLSSGSRLAIKLVQEKTEKSDMIRCERLSAKYPQQSPSLIVYALSGMELSPLNTGADAGYLLLSAASCLDIYDLFAKGRSSCSDIVSVENADGKLHLFEMPRGASAEDIKKIFGIKGELVCSSPLSKIVYDGASPRRTARLSEAELINEESSVCSRCGECSDICPMYLSPIEIASVGINRSKQNGVCVCIECGLCESVCPTRYPLLSKIRRAKEEVTSGEKNRY